METNKTNGKSMEFVKKIIQSGRCNGMENDMFCSMEEVNFLDVTQNLFEINREYIKFENNTYKAKYLPVNVCGKWRKLHIAVEYNPNAEFQYFTTECCVCDGTSSFCISLMKDIAKKIFSVGTCYEKELPKDYKGNLEDYDIHYTVGDFVVGEEYGKQFATKEKPWLQCEFTVMLPIKCKFIKKG